SRLVPRLARARRALEAGLEALGASGGGDVRFYLEAEARDLRDATIVAANLRLDAVSDDEVVVPGQEFELELSAWNGGSAALPVRMRPALPEGWTAHRADGEDAGEDVVVPPGDRVVSRWRVEVPHDAAPTRPYFLDIGNGDDAATRDALYDWPDDGAVRGLPFATAPIRGRFEVDIASDDDAQRLDVERAASWIGLDARDGEFRRPVRVVPRVSVRLSPELVVVPLSRLETDGARRLPMRVTVRSEGPDSTSGNVKLAVPEGWVVEPEAAPLTLAPEGGERTIRFDVTPPDGLSSGLKRVGAVFETPNPACVEVSPCAAPPRWVTAGHELIDYPHIDPHHLYRDAVSRVRALDVGVADVRVGYVAGVPDGVPEALDQLGVEWSSLDEATLADGDLSRFHTIVTGTRAYEVRPDLVAHNDRLLDWARAGGTLVVQYNKYPALDGSYAPWPVTIARPHGRVTDEDAPVTVLEPDHPIFNTPNRIGPEAWDDWVQERGLYFWDTWEGPLRPLLAMSDAGEEPLEGSLLVAPLGDGTYVYSALALFRQLPEGVPGAWRLLANLVSLGGDPRSD
ncbi:MAG: NEW3 domain-containing protein, partial [Gemmatimonadota bacterium]